MPDAGGRHFAVRSSRSSRTGHANLDAREAHNGGQRQRAGVHLDGDPALATGDKRRLDYIQPGKPIQNAFVESFNGRLRDELLNETLFRSLSHAGAALADWRNDYNDCRPHTSLEGLTPNEFARMSRQDHNQNGLHL